MSLHDVDEAIAHSSSTSSSILRMLFIRLISFPHLFQARRHFLQIYSFGIPFSFRATFCLLHIKKPTGWLNSILSQNLSLTFVQTTVLYSGETKSPAQNATIQDLGQVTFPNRPSISCPWGHGLYEIFALRTFFVLFTVMGGTTTSENGGRWVTYTIH